MIMKPIYAVFCAFMSRHYGRKESDQLPIRLRQLSFRQAGSHLNPMPSTGFASIPDSFSTLDQVSYQLQINGLESSNLIFGIDFTKSNEWSGRNSFFGRSLHCLDPTGRIRNPYEDAAMVLARALANFDDDNLIPAYGFGDGRTHDRAVFSLVPGDQPAEGLDEVLARYRQLVPHVKLAGPTSFAPLIDTAMRLVIESGMQYHILVIIADGQVTRSVDQPPGTWSPQEQATRTAIEAASYLPLSIIMVGVGDGPWDTMRDFDDGLTNRQFDNFQFVNYTELQSRIGHLPQEQAEAKFALACLMEVPEQYKAIQRLGLLGGRVPQFFNVSQIRRPLEPPPNAPAFVRQPAQPVTPPQQQAPTQQASAPAQQPQSWEPPERFMCPISQDVMENPVLLAGDGHTYDKVMIEQWLSNHETSPVTGAVLEHKMLIQNHLLRSEIREWQGR